MDARDVSFSSNLFALLHLKTKKPFRVLDRLIVKLGIQNDLDISHVTCCILLSF